MSLWERITGALRRDRTARDRGELDAPLDPATSTARPTSDETPEQPTQDANSSTGTSPNDEFVGRTGGDESGDVGLSGGEARAGHEIGGREGAARDE